MAKAKKTPQNGEKSRRGEVLEEQKKKPKFDLHPETKKSVLGVIFFTVAAIFIFSYFGYAGRAGEYMYAAFHALLGIGYFLVPLSFALIGVGLLRSLKTDIYFTSFFGGGLFLFSVLGLFDVIARYGVQQTEAVYPIGYVGFAISYIFL